jgi:ATP-dependent exoDNAse (exonuclease V) beta subunit
MDAAENPFPHVVITASAGTGKTFQLSNRFIQLAVEGPLDAILATTFTRKAAREILDRVLVRLAGAVSDPRKLSELNRHVFCPRKELQPAGSSRRDVRSTGFSRRSAEQPPEGGPTNTRPEGGTAGDIAPLDRAACARMLSRLISQLHRLRIGTLDSFFVQIAQSFSLELGFPPGWSIADEIVDQRLRAEAVRLLLEGESTSDVVRLMHLLTKGETPRSVTAQISALVAQLYAIYAEAPAEAWRALARRRPMAAAELTAALAALAATAPEEPRLAKSLQQDLASAAAEDWEAFLCKGLGAKILDGSRQYHRKPIPDAVLSVYRPLVDHAQAMLLDRIADQTEATHQLLERFDAGYQRLKNAGRALRFEDVTRKLAQQLTADRLEELVYRLDGRVSHLLLDEFQDTSALQWRVLRPLAQRLVRGEGGGRQVRSTGFSRPSQEQPPEGGTASAAGEQRPSFFCVGDVKQAIYGWRGGVAEIFEALDEELGCLPKRALHESFRSSPAVIDCVNRVFAEIGANPALQGCPGAARKWAERFVPHATARTDLPGYCRVAAGPRAAEGEDQATVTLCAAADRVVELRRQAPGFSVGVLVRRNQAVARMIYELRRRQVDASEEGGNPLTDSPAVQLILSLLTLADHPGDTTARFHVSTSPPATQIPLVDHRDAAAAWRFAEETRRRLLIDGYGPTLSRWAQMLADSCDRREQDRLEQLVELASLYEDQATTRPDDFVRLVGQQKVEDPTSAAVRVMTVHQAKGLQFDAVVLPELDVGVKGQPPELVAGCPKPAAPIERVCRYVSKDLRAILPRDFQRMFEAHDERVVEESLCLLYVAITRAVYALDVVLAPSRANERTCPATLAGVLRAALGGCGPIAPGEIVYEHGDADWARRASAGAVPPVASSPPSPTPRPPPLAMPQRPSRPTRGLERRSPSGLEGGELVDLGQRLRLARGPSLARGSVLHAWFQQVGWLEDGAPEDVVLERVALDLGLPAAEIPALVEQFRAALGHAAVRAALCSASYRQPAGPDEACRVHAGPDIDSPRWELRREYPFAVRDEEAILSGQFDRLVVLYDGDRTLGADVLDYKSDDLPAGDPGALAARAEHYRPQLEAYCRAAAQLTGLAPDRISARLLFLKLGVVYAVG